MEIFGYLSAIIIGLSLGMIGSGGSILTVPVLVYFMGLNPSISAAYSLFIVGITSLVGSYSFYKKGMVAVKTALIFGLPSIGAVYVTRKYLVPAIPRVVLSSGEFILTKDMLLMSIFALLMIFSAFSMLGSKQTTPNTHPDWGNKLNYGAILAEGVMVGILTALVGAGGGFLILPALVMFAKLPFNKAIGTTLLVIAINCFFGFMGDLSNYRMDWLLLILFSALSVCGIFIGMALSAKIPGCTLKKVFAWVVLGLGIYIFTAELF